MPMPKHREEVNGGEEKAPYSKFQILWIMKGKPSKAAVWSVATALIAIGTAIIGAIIKAWPSSG